MNSREVLDTLARFEPLSVQGQAPVVWDRAEGVHVHDADGRVYLDWSSGVLVANTGHGHPEVVEAIVEAARKPLLFSYSFPTLERAELLSELEPLLPRPDDKILLLSTGSEAVEVALKLALTHAQRASGGSRRYVVSFERSFHGRTAGAQLAGGIPALKEWLQATEGPFVNVPFPDGFRTQDTSFDGFERSLADQGVAPAEVALVIMESYQGGGASFAPVSYMRALESWCRDNDVILTMDEVQAGFGRTGEWFAYEHYGITPDLVCCGKGISSSLPLSALIGRRELLDQYGPGSMSSTHGGHPICAAAATANLKVMRRDGLVENAECVGKILEAGLATIAGEYAFVAALHGKGLVYGMHIVDESGVDPDSERAIRIVTRCVENGLMLFLPVGFGGATVKICPPLTITAGQIEEGLQILVAAFAAEGDYRG